MKNSAKKILFTIISSLIFLAFPAEALAAASLGFTPASGTFNRGCNFALTIDVDTGGAQTDGTDAIITYDPTRFSVTSIVSGSIYEDYPGNNDDPQTGKITVSGLASVTQPFVGKGTLATLNFTVKPTAPLGATTVKFEFDPNDKAKTTDSNVVERGTVVDVLNSVTNGNYSVGTGTCASQGGGVPGGGGLPGDGSGGGIGKKPIGGGNIPATPSNQYKQLPEGGTEEFTYTLAIVGSVLTVLGILGFALL